MVSESNSCLELAASEQYHFVMTVWPHLNHPARKTLAYSTSSRPGTPHDELTIYGSFYWKLSSCVNTKNGFKHSLGRAGIQPHDHRVAPLLLKLKQHKDFYCQSRLYEFCTSIQDALHTQTLSRAHTEGTHLMLSLVTKHNLQVGVMYEKARSGSVVNIFTVCQQCQQKTWSLEASYSLQLVLTLLFTFEIC